MGMNNFWIEFTEINLLWSRMYIVDLIIIDLKYDCIATTAVT